MMKRISKIVLSLLVLITVLWQLPWGYNLLKNKHERNPFILYSPISEDFIGFYREEGKPMERRDTKGNTYTQEEVDSLLPCIYMKQLLSQQKFPRIIRGENTDIKQIQAKNFMFRSTPRTINAPVLGLYPLMESISKRVDLKMPEDVFRITDKEMQFVRMVDNSIDTLKSQRFTEVLKAKGFMFPALYLHGNPTTHKDYDEGYLVVDSKNQLFHIKSICSRPFVKRVELPGDCKPEVTFVAEFRNRQILGFVCSEAGMLYVLSSDYSMNKIELENFNPRKNDISIFGTYYVWTIVVGRENEIDYYAISPKDYSAVKSMKIEKKTSKFDLLHFTSVDDKFVRPRFPDA